MEGDKDNIDQAKEFQKKYLAHADETRKMLVDKHERELLTVHEKHLEAEMQWEQEKQQLLKNIESLKAVVSRQESDISKMSRSCRTQEEQVTAESLRGELSMFRERARFLEQSELNQIAEINQLRKAQRESEANFSELVAANQRIKELEFRMKNLDSALSARSTETDESLKKLKEDLRSLNFEKRADEANVKMFELKCKELQRVTEGLREELKNARMANSELTTELNTLKAALDNRKPITEKGGQTTTFRDFVHMQRELVLLRDQNEELRKKLKIRQQSKDVPGLLTGPAGKGNDMSGTRNG